MEVNLPHLSSTARRVSEYKAPRTHRNAQEQRRALALAEQKKKRAERIESSRNIDLFAGLTISSPNPATNDLQAVQEDEDDGDEDDVVIPQGLAQFASMLPPALKDPSSPDHQLPTAFGSTSIVHSRRTPKRKNKRHRHKARSKKNPDQMDTEVDGPLANAIMYAELLEMNTDMVEWNVSIRPALEDASLDDGMPSDLETGWVALAPIPKGKRCMAVSYQAIYEGRDEPATRTLLHSRVKGKPFLTFPSPLPPDSILDCILDENWYLNGVLHIVDILRWRGSDFTDCETEFRFWWRDAKLAELSRLPLPNAPVPSSPTTPVASTSTAPPVARLFPYPVSFAPVPYFTPPLTLPFFLQTMIPSARAGRQLTIEVPIPRPSPRRRQRTRNKGKGVIEVEMADGAAEDNANEAMDEPPDSATVGNGGLEIDELDEFGRSTPAAMALDHQNPMRLTHQPRSRMETVNIASDGILLYVSQASYQPGETPLSCWIPAEALESPSEEPMAVTSNAAVERSPLDIFERLVYRRCAVAQSTLPAASPFNPSTNTSTS